MSAHLPPSACDGTVRGGVCLHEMRLISASCAVLAAAAAATVTVAAHAAPPVGPPPSAGNLKTPPPAWVETERGSRWLGFSTFCWVSGCADYIRPRCGDEHTPTLRLRRGERVRFHVGFAPKEVSLTAGNQRVYNFKPERIVAWRSTSTGAFSLFIRAKRGGDASYVACVRFA